MLSHRFASTMKNQENGKIILANSGDFLLYQVRLHTSPYQYMDSFFANGTIAKENGPPNIWIAIDRYSTQCRRICYHDRYNLIAPKSFEIETA